MPTTPFRLEVYLAAVAAAAVTAFAACDDSGGASGDGSDSTSDRRDNPSVGPGESCANGKDPMCSCTRPAEATERGTALGPPKDGGSHLSVEDALDGASIDAGELDGGAVVAFDPSGWTCEMECEANHGAINARLESCAYAGAAPNLTVTCSYYLMCVGRRPAEHVERTASARSPADILMAMADLEEQSIGAFVRLARELAHHRAPTGLVVRSREAARDEVRHARQTRALAASFGAEAPDRRLRSRPRRRRVPGLVDLLVENAVEGCVRETFGALMAHVQAALATDHGARRTMAEVAADESRHAALAWAIHAWGVENVSPEDRARIEDARRRAAHALIRGIECGEGEPRNGALGLVGAREARSLAASLEALWSGALAA